MQNNHSNHYAIMLMASKKAYEKIKPLREKLSLKFLIMQMESINYPLMIALPYIYSINSLQHSLLIINADNIRPVNLRRSIPRRGEQQ